jgi:hypothetical protein
MAVEDVTILGAPYRRHVHVLSFRLLVSARVLLDGFFLKFGIEYLMKICREKLNLVKIGQK